MQPARSQKSARQLIERALAAMGGAEKIQAIKTVRVEEMSYRNALEQSERPEGPWIVEWAKITELRDFEHGQLRRESDVTFGPFPFKQTIIATESASAASGGDGQLRPRMPGEDESLALGPERLLLTALAARDLRRDPDTVLHDFAHQVVTFTWRSHLVRIFLNAHTGMPTAVEIVRPVTWDLLRSWGDVTTRTVFSFWQLEKNGIRFPHQSDVLENEQPWRSTYITKLEFNPQIPPTAFDIPEAVRSASAKLPGAPVQIPAEQVKQVAPGIWQIVGAWNTELIKQEDGIVVLEAPISSAYSARVLEEVARRFPGERIKAVISTSDSWPHFGGIREYAARGVPLYILDLNRPIIERFLAAPFRSQPDTLAQHPRRADLRLVSAKTTIGDGPNRLDIYPYRTQNGERMMMVYFPQHHLLYGSDLTQPFGDGDWGIEYYTEVQAAVAREGLTPERLFAMHMQPIAWDEVAKTVQKYLQGQ